MGATDWLGISIFFGQAARRKIHLAMSRKQGWAIAAVTALFISLGLLAIFIERQTQQPPVQTGMTGAAIHATAFKDLAGVSRSLAQWSDRHILVNFWASWCAPCIEEIPRLVKLQATSHKNLQIVGIAVDSTHNAKSFHDKLQINYPVFVDEAGAMEFSKRLGNRTGLLPFSALINPRGDIVATYLGAISADKILQINDIVR
jgi:thiol-disulfide isomerase/thioredoxin